MWLREMLISAAIVENCMEVPKKAKNKTTNYPATFRRISRGNEIHLSKRPLHSHVYYITIHNNQEMEITLSVHPLLI